MNKGLSQDDLARLAGVSKMTIWRMENDRTVSRKKAFAVCQALGVEAQQVEGLKFASSRV